MPLKFAHRPGLLVSVRNRSEALAALAGGADVIDVKEPSRGSLGAADNAEIADVVRAVAGRAPVTAAAGELVDLIQNNIAPMPSGVALFKLGLAGCRDLPSWKTKWLGTIKRLWHTDDATKHAVAVTYADWRTAGAPSPHDVLQIAAEWHCAAVLVDTYDKSAGTLFDHWPAGELISYVAAAHSRKLPIVLAGSLTLDLAIAAARMQPDLIAVRTAACINGRDGAVSQQRVDELREAIRDVTPVLTGK